MKNKSKGSKEPIYRSINAPVKVRQEALESAKAIIALLQEFRHVDDLREERAVLTDNFGKQVQELNQLLSDTYRMMPKVKVAAPKKMKQKGAKEEKMNVMADTKMSHDRELISELKDIEKKLKELQ